MLYEVITLEHHLDSGARLSYFRRMPTLKLTIMTPERGGECALPLYLAQVAAGFPSPAEDYIDKKLDLNEHLT